MESSNNLNNFNSLSTFSPGETSYQTVVKSQQKRKRTTTKCHNIEGVVVSKPKPSRKPDPSAPKITRPCTECGKRFWSEKALFGHMRCHPERQWRGINPPPNIRCRGTTIYDAFAEPSSSSVTEEDHEIAKCLLLLANGASLHTSQQQSPSLTTVNQCIPEPGSVHEADPDTVLGFECSSCKKVFGSHQALGGHRASHKNVKGCYAITKNDGCMEEDGFCVGDDNVEITTSLMGFEPGHKCGICSRVFSSGQALGGHKRCHWEKNVDEAIRVCGGGFDLNLPARVEDEEVSLSNYGLELSLDLRLGL